MKTLIIADYGVKIRFRNGVFIVEKKDGKIEVPPLSVEQVIIATGGVSITSKVVRKMIDYGIDLVILDTHGLPIGRIYPPYINRTVETRRAQYRIYGRPEAVYIVKELIHSKIANQAELLKKYYYSTRIRELREAVIGLVQLGDKVYSVDEEDYRRAVEEIRVIESKAARIYWPYYAVLVPDKYGFDSRDQDSTDPVNTLLNYGYGVMYKECWRALVLAGLDPYAGYMHVDRSGKPVLVFDFIEQFRFIIDYVVLRILRRGWIPDIKEGLLTHSSRRYFISKLEEFLDKNKTRYMGEQAISFRQAIKRSAYLLASHIRGEGLFKGFIWE